MAHTRSWDEASPAGSDLVSSLDNTIRNKLVDVRERAVVDHIWGTSTSDDGKHRQVTLKPSDNTVEIATDTQATTTGAGTTGIIDLARTLNTTGVVTAILITLTNTASNAASRFFDFVVGTTSILTLTIDGVLKFAYLQNFREKINALGTGTGAVTIDCRDGNVITCNNTGARTVSLSNVPTVGYFALRLIITAGASAAASWTWTLTGTVKYSGGVAPALTTTSGKIDLVDLFTVDGGTTWIVTMGGANA